MNINIVRLLARVTNEQQSLNTTKHFYTHGIRWSRSRLLLSPPTNLLLSGESGCVRHSQSHSSYRPDGFHWLPSTCQSTARTFTMCTCQGYWLDGHCTLDFTLTCNLFCTAHSHKCVSEFTICTEPPIGSGETPKQPFMGKATWLILPVASAGLKD